MKVLLVSSSLPNGGKERQIIELTKVLLKNNLDIKVISFSNRANAIGIDLIANNLIIIDKNQGYFKVQQKYYSEIKKFNPDIVHAWDHMSALMSVLPKCRLRFKLIDGSIRGSKRFFKRRFFMLLTWFFTDKVVANSKAGLISASKRLNKKNIVIYNGFDGKRVSRVNDDFDFKQKLMISDKKVVGMLANIKPAKDYLGFIKLAEIVLMQREDVVFVSLGQGNIDDKLLTGLNETIRNRILFLGRVDNPEEYIRSFEIGLLLNDTRHGREGISNAIIEYMAMSKPVVATNAGGNPEIVHDGESGFLVPAFDMQAVAQKILLLLDDKNRSEQFGTKGKKIIEDTFSQEKMTNNYLRLYDELNASSSGSKF